jgi:hypothetical protein
MRRTMIYFVPFGKSLFADGSYVRLTASDALFQYTALPVASRNISTSTNKGKGKEAFE